jgi:hypothetical protein
MAEDKPALDYQPRLDTRRSLSAPNGIDRCNCRELTVMRRYPARCPRNSSVSSRRASRAGHKLADNQSACVSEA